FLVKVVVELLWLAILLVFYATVFSQTTWVAGWSESEYMLFLGCYFALESAIETLFLSNCNEFADLVRTGELDLILLKPIDEQFLVSCRSIDWSTVPNIFLGVGVITVALVRLEWSPNVVQVLLFLLLFASGVALAYSFLLCLTSASVWMLRNQSLFELCWLVTSLMLCPREVLSRTWFAPISWFFTFIVPILLVVNVPASGLARLFEPDLVGLALVATVVMLVLSRKLFRLALRRYRSASS